jgi:tRNA-specific 2-thiouridylase
MAIMRRSSNACAPMPLTPGDIVHVDGRTLGRHDGIIHYTIGQRKGLGIGGGVSDENSPLYVVRLDAATGRVIVGPKESLARNIVRLKEATWLMDMPADGIAVSVKLRSASRVVEAKLYPSPSQGQGGGQLQDDPLNLQSPSLTFPLKGGGDDSVLSAQAVLILDTPQYGIAPGQAAVCYIGDRCIGGGWIADTDLQEQAIAA